MFCEPKVSLCEASEKCDEGWLKLGLFSSIN